MHKPAQYIPSRILPGNCELVRQHSFTRWMSIDLLQAATDFCKNLGMIPLYGECSPDHLTRYLFWRPPVGARFEVRTGRPDEKFREFDHSNLSRCWPLLSLHINESDLYSAVWISPDHYDTAAAMLAFYGITPAQRNLGV